MSLDAKEASIYDGEPVECYRFTDGANVYRYTSSDQLIQIPLDSPVDYVPTSVTRGQIQFSHEDSAGDVEITLPRADAVSIFFISYAPTAQVSVVIYRIHRGDTEAIVVFTGIVSSTVFDGGAARLRCTALSNVFSKLIPTIYYQKTCNWVLYGSGCGIDKDATDPFSPPGTYLYRVTAPSVTISGATISDSIFGTKADGYFSTGFAQSADGQKRYIVSHVGNDLLLMSPFIGTVGAVIAYAGCDRTEATCGSKFSNSPRFLGFPRIPTKNVYTKGIT